MAIVEAFQITRLERVPSSSDSGLVLVGEFPDETFRVRVSDAYIGKHDPQPGNYFYRTDDGEVGCAKFVGEDDL